MDALKFLKWTPLDYFSHQLTWKSLRTYCLCQLVEHTQALVRSVSVARVHTPMLLSSYRQLNCPESRTKNPTADNRCLGIKLGDHVWFTAVKLKHEGALNRELLGTFSPRREKLVSIDTCCRFSIQNYDSSAFSKRAPQNEHSPSSVASVCNYQKSNCLWRKDFFFFSWAVSLDLTPRRHKNNQTFFVMKKTINWCSGISEANTNAFLLATNYQEFFGTYRAHVKILEST